VVKAIRPKDAAASARRTMGSGTYHGDPGFQPN